MAQATQADRTAKTDAGTTEKKAQSLESRYGVIGCAAVRAATLLSRSKPQPRKSKGYSSQT